MLAHLCKSKQSHVNVITIKAIYLSSVVSIESENGFSRNKTEKLKLIFAKKKTSHKALGQGSVPFPLSHQPPQYVSSLALWQAGMCEVLISTLFIYISRLLFWSCLEYRISELPPLSTHPWIELKGILAIQEEQSIVFFSLFDMISSFNSAVIGGK